MAALSFLITQLSHLPNRASDEQTTLIIGRQDGLATAALALLLASSAPYACHVNTSSRWQTHWGLPLVHGDR